MHQLVVYKIQNLKFVFVIEAFGAALDEMEILRLNCDEQKLLKYQNVIPTFPHNNIILNRFFSGKPPIFFSRPNQIINFYRIFSFKKNPGLTYGFLTLSVHSFTPRADNFIVICNNNNNNKLSNVLLTRRRNNREQKFLCHRVRDPRPSRTNR